jgi:3-oxoacyl-[acyl-carrier-protein] synthase-3
MKIAIKGIGSYLPEQVITNVDLEQIMDTSDEWISQRTGIRSRHIANVDTSELGYRAALKALEDAGVEATDIDLIITGTFTGDGNMPSVACLIQDKLGITKNCTSFDLNAACSGFVYSLNVAVSMLKSGNYKKALVIGAENITKTLDWKDRGTAILFGDGAGAVVIGEDQTSEILNFHTGSKGDKEKVLTLGNVINENPYSELESYAKGQLAMNGQAVFKFATRIVKKSINAILEQDGTTLEDYKYVVCHQANSRILEATAKSMKADINKFYMNLDRVGNTSAASIPIALDEMVKKGLVTKGDRLILVGFGGGLTWGAVSLTY